MSEFTRHTSEALNEEIRFQKKWKECMSFFADTIIYRLRLKQAAYSFRLNVSGSSPCSPAGECFSPGSTFCADSPYFGIRSTPVLPQVAGGRLQLNTHSPYVCGFAWSDLVHGCMVYTERAETAAVSCSTRHVSAVSTPLRWIFKNAP